jgi:hypothetical protein
MIYFACGFWFEIYRRASAMSLTARCFRYKHGLRLAGKKRTKNALVDNEAIEARLLGELELKAKLC